MFAYIDWQFFQAPRWLAGTLWNLELALLRFFSVGLMLRTLFAHWHRDATPYLNRGLTEILTVFLLNQISRGVGAVVRSAVLVAWVGAQVIYLVLALGFFLIFITAPFLIVIAAVAGLGSLLT